MNVGRRLQLHGPQLGMDVPWWQVWHGHGGDEYGNCSVYFQTALTGGFTFFFDPHYQDEIEVPAEEENARCWQRWYARKYGGRSDDDA